MQYVEWEVPEAWSLLSQMDCELEAQLQQIRQQLLDLRKLCLRGPVTPEEILLLAETQDCLDASEYLEPDLTQLRSRIRLTLQRASLAAPALLQAVSVYSPALDFSE